VSRLSRRAFVVAAGATSLGLLAGCGRLPGQAAPLPRVYRVGFLASPALSEYRQAFLQGMADLGYVEGQNLILDTRGPREQDASYIDAVAQLVDLPVDIIVSASASAIADARRATSRIPIVMAGTGADPVQEGLVASLARPGGNVTGLSVLTLQLTGKRLELLTQAVPGTRRVGVLANPAMLDTQWREIEVAAEALGVETRLLELRSPADFDSAFEVVRHERIESLYSLADPVTIANQRQLGNLSATKGVPGIHPMRGFVDAGGLMSYGPSAVDSFRRAAYYVDRILKGAKPADLPVEQPMTFDFVVNLKTAQALGITFPNEIMLQVTEVIR
jgi:putative tryptophan/tyrosine transport system substrate-binding protein